ncbi:MAG: TVP38/TMEM64 family protein [Leptolyngbyaceae cyanobacterium RM2_2_4]|nr:TVP38/TMEM64 family protein [Leptolyngbyaceae cyanobacterium SM1_4_3]NJN90882.1 TVP38/TMEM64 family protein [Leptolyngbyaceae cyanobacterium SL_5_14]NJO50585.1 TVP38/TMEM64 family protein [Leptolyngbyaceae cyanobacterium RM2_2_4]
MLKLKQGAILLTAACLVATALTAYLISGINPAQIQVWLEQAGVWAPVAYIALYVTATLLILPSTALNLAGGAIFGVWLGTLWTSFAALIAAIAAFAFTRTVGRKLVASRLAGRWQAMDAEMVQGGLFYMFAIRLLPIIPYGLVNFAAGLTSVSFKDYTLGTALGTVPGVLPFVMLGSSGLNAMRTGETIPLIGALSLISILVAGATWYRCRNS